MAKTNSNVTTTGGTRRDFIAAAKRLFAERGFYGTSIASIATELGLTKQALIHHFASKERLYGEVLAQMADRLSAVVDKARSARPGPAKQVEELLLTLYTHALDHPDDTQLLMRELLDNPRRGELAQHWYLKDFLDSMVSTVRKVPKTKALTEVQALARVYLLLGAFNYFLVSQPTLRQMYGKRAFGALRDQIPHELRRLVRTALGD